jgi:DNA primase
VRIPEKTFPVLWIAGISAIAISPRRANGSIHNQQNGIEMRFPQSFLDEIRDRVPISSVIGQRVPWDKKKTNVSRGDYWGCCPFHGEKTPSFHCEDRKGRYHCFGCGVTGDHFRFLTELDGLAFPEAVERIAEMAGVAMPARDPESEKREQQRATLHDVMELAARFFQQKLQEAEGAKARAYLRERGLTSVTQKEFGLGYAPDSRNALKEFLASKGVDKILIEACGLVVHGPDIAVSYDRFRDRIMFPITDTRERVIAFGGRALSADIPAKYLNSPETELFHKGRVLYNLARARRASRKGETLIAVEGYMDVIALHQAGIASAVAPLGTALTEEQLSSLWRENGDPVLCFDGDQAGLKAAWRAADLALPLVGPGRSMRFALLPEGCDPDDIVREGGGEAFHAILADARPLADLIWMRETSGGVFETPEQRAELEKRLRDITGRIQDESVRRHYSQEMRDRIQAFFGRNNQRSRMEGTGRGKHWPSKGGRPGAAQSRMAVSETLARSGLVRKGGGTMPMREAALIVGLVNHPLLIEEDFELFEGLEFTSTGARRLQQGILDVLAHEPAANSTDIKAYFESAGMKAFWDEAIGLVRRARLWHAMDDAALEDAREGLRQAVHLHKSARTLHRELKAAEAALASEPTEANYLSLLEIQSQLRDSQATEALVEGFGVASGRAGKH